MKDSFNAPDCCVDCKVDTPEKFFGCESPCDKYRQEVARRAEARVNLDSQLSVEHIKHHPLVEEYEDCILHQDSDSC